MNLLDLIQKYEQLSPHDTHARDLFRTMILNAQRSEIRKSEIEHKIDLGVSPLVAGALDTAAAVDAAEAEAKDINAELKNIASGIKLEENSVLGQIAWQAHFCRSCEESMLPLINTKKYKLEHDKLTKNIDKLVGGDYQRSGFNTRNKFRTGYSKIKTLSSVTSYILLNYILPHNELWQTLSPQEQNEMLAQHNNNPLTIFAEVVGE